MVMVWKKLCLISTLWILISMKIVYMGRKNMVNFPSGAKRVKQILELVHSDVFGPVLVHHSVSLCTMYHL